MQDDYLDSDVLQVLIDAGVSLGFHGHQHRSTFVDEFSRVGQLNRKITVFSASTLCAGPTQLTPGEPRGFNIIEIDAANWKGHVHQRRMVNSDFTLPIWGPGTFVESGKSFLEFSICPPPTVRPPGLESRLSVEKAELFVSQKRWDEAILTLRNVASDSFARVLLAQAIENSNDSKAALELLWPPLTVKEAIIVGGAILELGNRDQAVAFSELPFIANNEDPSVREIWRRITERRIR